MIHIVIADDHALVLQGLVSLLSDEPDIQVVDTAPEWSILAEKVSLHQPDVVISDIHMPGMDVSKAVPRLRELAPACHILLLTAYNDGQTLHAAVASGADGLLLKTAPPDQALQAIRQVMVGQLIFPAAVRRWLTTPPPPSPIQTLSEREREVLSLVAQGLSNTEVAHRLFISENTVKFHLQSIYRSLNITNRTEATNWYLRNKP